MDVSNLLKTMNMRTCIFLIKPVTYSRIGKDIFLVEMKFPQFSILGQNRRKVGFCSQFLFSQVESGFISNCDDNILSIYCLAIWFLTWLRTQRRKICSLYHALKTLKREYLFYTIVQMYDFTISTYKQSKGITCMNELKK
jgi:hypothetical protein